MEPSLPMPEIYGWQKPTPITPAGNLDWQHWVSRSLLIWACRIRFDIASFLTVRVDIGVPIKKPYVHSNSGWVIDKLDFYNSTWRKDNVIPVVTIGYPF